MAVLIAFQFDDTIHPQQIKNFRVRLHELPTFRACWSDSHGACIELPLNVLICNYEKTADAKQHFEVELGNEGLSTNLDLAVYSSISNDTLVSGFKLCKLIGCTF